jgi:hypothetical protein
VKLTAAATKAACVDIQLTQGRDGSDQMPASNAFTEPEIDTLEALGPTLQGKTERQQNPHPMHSLAPAFAGAGYGRRGSSLAWVAGTATTSRRARSLSAAAWSISTQSTAEGTSK